MKCILHERYERQKAKAEAGVRVARSPMASMVCSATSIGDAPRPLPVTVPVQLSLSILTNMYVCIVVVVSAIFVVMILCFVCADVYANQHSART